MTTVRFAPPFYCPYCGEEDIRPDELEPAAPSDTSSRGTADTPRSGGSAGAYRCESCLRAFTLRLNPNRGGR